MIYLLLLFGFAILIGGGNILVDGAVAVAKRLHVSPLLIGLTLIGFGTSTPELMTSLFAAAMDAEGIAVGNVVGSNIANIFLVLGVAASIYAIPVNTKSFKRDSLFLCIATGVLVFALLLGRIGFIIGFLMCATLGYYVYYSYKTEQQKAPTEIKNIPVSHKKNNHKDIGLAVAKTVAGIILTVVGARVLVINSVVLAERWGVSETVIGLTIVALGTSLPELATSIIASLKKHSDLAWGNVIGSNIYNALFILGTTALIVPVNVPRNISIDVLIMLLATALLLYFGHRGRLPKWGGWLFCALYILYVGYLAAIS